VTASRRTRPVVPARTDPPRTSSWRTIIAGGLVIAAGLAASWLAFVAARPTGAARVPLLAVIGIAVAIGLAGGTVWALHRWVITRGSRR
jgi:high-affinity Fe2+/Pb2+ permease